MKIIGVYTADVSADEIRKMVSEDLASTETTLHTIFIDGSEESKSLSVTFTSAESGVAVGHTESGDLVVARLGGNSRPTLIVAQPDDGA